ncbi:MAG TPA: M23 family metallopeptidase [Pseudolysinimonas sp.]|jgi:murein DD-endopeptidase MepM/ murein hydrolase activator NlpD
MWFRMAALALLVGAAVGGSPEVPAAAAPGGPNASVAGLGTASPPVASLGSWAWPVSGAHAIARPYLAPAGPYAAGHRGVDIRSTDGAPVLAPAGGVVHFAGFVVDRPVLSIEHSGGLLSSYEPVTTTLVAGDRVSRGEAIGTLLPGHCASTCLHLGVRVDGEYVNPLLFLGGVGWSVLYPRG